MLAYRVRMKLTTILICGALVMGVANVARGQTLDPKGLSVALASKPAGAAAEQLAAQIRAWFGGSENLAKGPGPKIDELTVAWAIEAPGLAANAPAPRVVSDACDFPCRVSPTRLQWFSPRQTVHAHARGLVPAG